VTKSDSGDGGGGDKRCALSTYNALNMRTGYTIASVK